jgi:hypothetical protein
MESLGIVAFFFGSCMFILSMVAWLSGACNEGNCWKSVKTRYPGCKILQDPDHSFRFYVFVGEEMRLVKTLNLTNCEISSDIVCKELVS